MRESLIISPVVEWVTMMFGFYKYAHNVIASGPHVSDFYRIQIRASG